MKSIEQVRSHARDHAAYGWSSQPYEMYGVTDAERREIYMAEYKQQKEREEQWQAREINQDQ